MVQFIYLHILNLDKCDWRKWINQSDVTAFSLWQSNYTLLIKVYEGLDATLHFIAVDTNLEKKVENI